MKNNIIKILQTPSLRLSLCALALSFGNTVSYAQDEIDDEEVITVKTPRRQTAADKNPTVMVGGIIIDEATNAPIAGARVQTLDDNRYAAMTDAEGKFSIKVPTFATSLYVQAPRYMSQQVAIRSNDDKQQIKVFMISDAFTPMYENGNTITAQKSFTSAGGGVSVDEEISRQLGADIRTIKHSGSTDQGAAMFIRGINSLNANSQPLIIVDGVELDMQRSRRSLHQGDIFNMLSTISPEDIDKVKVLKNATALYGARGANGVILIDTKRGHSMATRIDVKASLEINLKPSLPKMMNASQYRNYAVEQLGTIDQVIEAQKSAMTMLDFRFLNDNPQAYGYHTYHNDTNWSDEIYKTGVTQNYSINVQGGDDIGMYNLSVAYVQKLKNVHNTTFDRINVRFNTDISILENVSTKFDMSFSKTNSKLYDDGFAADISASPITSPTNLALIKSPLLNPYQYSQNTKGFTALLSEADDLYDELGSGYSLSNPIALMSNAQGDRKNKNENTFFNVAVQPTWEITPNLKLATHFSYYLNRNSQAYYRPNIGIAPFFIEGLGTVYSKVASIFSKENNIISNTHIDWAKKLGAHDIAVTGGFRYNSFSYDNSDLTSEYTKNGTEDKNPTLAIGNTTTSTITGADDEWKNMQWYVSGDYNYANRYYATVSLLAEANSRFGENADGAVKAFGTQWALFPSVQLGWVMTNEKWFPKSCSIDFLRVNVGFDMSGNDDISNYAAQNIFSSVPYNNEVNYDKKNKNSTRVGMQLTNIGNDKVKWETTTKWNFGVLLNMLHNRLSFGADYYIHTTKDLLALKSFENPIGGINNYWVNDGKLRNVGVEVSLAAKPVVTKNLTVEAGATIGHYSNKVLSLTNGDYTASIYGTDNILTSVGNGAGLFYGYSTRGTVFATTKDAASVASGVLHINSEGKESTNLCYVDETGAKVDFEAGDVCFVDKNGDGIINEADKSIIGDPTPDIYGNIFANLKYKRFGLRIGFNYCLGNDVYNYQRSILNSGSTLYNQQVAEIGRWRYEGQITNLPKVCYGDPKGNNRFSDRWIEDGSYLRLKTILLSYEIPIPESWQAWLQGISIWGEARNVFTLTKYTGSDPEFSISNNQFYQGIDCGNIAQGRAFTFGVKINM